MKKQNGITLIALVISIIVMLILVGVSINAIVGENGVLSRAQYSSFMSEMAAVEEAVQLWKAGELMETKGEVDTAIPANGLCKVNDLTAAERLVGEIGYYRTWSIGDTMPTMNILSSAEEFNKKYESEFIYYPAGVQDLYYLNNEALDLDEHKVYLIDAATSIVYSTTGITLNGVRCYSTSMAKAVMGNNVAPIFTEAEMSGGGDNIVYAGATYLKDKYGNYIDENGNIVSEENKVINQNGFQIIASINSNNVYKLYNNGDLYGKGIKGSQLNSSSEDLAGIDSTKWSTFEIPSEIENYKKVIQGHNTMYIIDDENKLWAWGENEYNKLGLTEEEQIDYTGREPIKLNVNGKDVKKVWDSYYNCFVLTTENELYGMGLNTSYQLGLGHNNIVYNFQKIDVKSPEKIKCMHFSKQGLCIIIAYEDNTFLVGGPRARGIIGGGTSGDYKRFNPIWDGYVYVEDTDGKYIIDETIGYNANIDIDQDIKSIVTANACGVLILKNDKTVLYSGPNLSWVTEESFNSYYLSEFPDDIGKDVKEIYSTGYGYIIQKENGDIYGANGVRACVGFKEANKSVKKIEVPDELMNVGIKEIFTVSYVDMDSAVYYLDNNGEVWGSSNTAKYVGGVAKPQGIEKLNLPLIKSFYEKGESFQKVYSSEAVHKCATQLFLGEDGQCYSIGDETLLFRNDILQKSWIKIASNVEKVAFGENETIAYIEKNTNKVFVAGNDSRILAQNTEIQEKIPNFIQLNNELIDGKVKDIYFPCGQMVVLTTDNQLYSTGIYSLDGSHNWPNDRVPGWEENENHYTFVKLMDDVTMFNGSEYTKMLIANNELYLWGILEENYATRMPTKLNLKSKFNDFDESNIKKITTETQSHQIIDNNGNYYAKFKRENQVTDWKQYNLDLNNEKVIDIVEGYRTSTVIVLTEDGNVYGRGDFANIGIGKTAGWTNEFIKLPIENVIQITRGNGFFIAVTADGKVYGTGSNQYGILGRWIGIDRNSPNSRYKTAFDWVECPELEI